MNFLEVDEDDTERLFERARQLVNKENLNKLQNEIVTKTRNVPHTPLSANSQAKVTRSAKRELRKEWNRIKKSTLKTNTKKSKSPSEKEILLGVVAYVEVDNNQKKESIEKVLHSLGATVNDNFNHEVTHIVYKNGCFETFKRAKLLNVYLVSVLWIEACKNSKKRVPEKLFPVVDHNNYTGSPRMFRRFMERGMQASLKFLDRTTKRLMLIEANGTDVSLSSDESGDSDVTIVLSPSPEDEDQADASKELVLRVSTDDSQTDSKLVDDLMTDDDCVEIQIESSNEIKENTSKNVNEKSNDEMTNSRSSNCGHNYSTRSKNTSKHSHDTQTHSKLVDDLMTDDDSVEIQIESSIEIKQNTSNNVIVQNSSLETSKNEKSNDKITNSRRSSNSGIDTRNSTSSKTNDSRSNRGHNNLTRSKNTSIHSNDSQTDSKLVDDVMTDDDSVEIQIESSNEIKENTSKNVYEKSNDEMTNSRSSNSGIDTRNSTSSKTNDSRSNCGHNNSTRSKNASKHSNVPQTDSKLVDDLVTDDDSVEIQIESSIEINQNTSNNVIVQNSSLETSRNEKSNDEITNRRSSNSGIDKRTSISSRTNNSRSNCGHNYSTRSKNTSKNSNDSKLSECEHDYLKKTESEILNETLNYITFRRKQCRKNDSSLLDLSSSSVNLGKVKSESSRGKDVKKETDSRNRCKRKLFNKNDTEWCDVSQESDVVCLNPYLDNDKENKRRRRRNIVNVKARNRKVKENKTESSLEQNTTNETSYKSTDISDAVNNDKDNEKKKKKTRNVFKKKTEEWDRNRKKREKVRKKVATVVERLKPVYMRTQRSSEYTIHHPSLVGTYLHRSENSWVKESVEQLGKFKVKANVAADTTHIVAGAPVATINLLKALAKGCWILDKRWIEDSLKAGRWLRENDYEMVGFSPAVMKNRIERSALGNDYTIDIFKDAGNIYVGPDTTPSNKDLKCLIKLCKGRVVEQPSDAKVIIGVAVVGRVCVTEQWVIRCVRDGKLKRFREFLLT